MLNRSKVKLAVTGSSFWWGKRCNLCSLLWNAVQTGQKEFFRFWVFDWGVGGQTERESCRRLLFLSVFLKTKQNGAFIAFSVQSTFGKEQPKSHFGRGHLGGLSRTDEMITFHSRTLLVVAYRYATLKNLWLLLLLARLCRFFECNQFGYLLIYLSIWKCKYVWKIPRCFLGR